jgi:DNA-binding HxlR family transcriptional regulator
LENYHHCCLAITAKVLSKELKDLEINELVKRTVYDTKPVSVEYELTPYGHSLEKIIDEMRSWGINHRCRISGKQNLEEVQPD